MYLRQQLQSFLPGDALQFHTVWPSPVQDVIDELVQGGPTGYFFCFFLLLRKFPCPEEMDGMLCPCWTLGLDDKDQGHLFRHGGSRLYGQGLAPRRRQLPLGGLRIRGNTLAGSPWELSGNVLVGA